ncbi:MAG: hypothetical protein EOM59_11770 [Clostridia bacterium]|nr:hypothetical protein [Clostridia bacterium]
MGTFEQKAMQICDKAIKLRHHPKFYQLIFDWDGLCVILNSSPTYLNLHNDGTETKESYNEFGKEQPCDILAELDKLIGEK